MQYNKFYVILIKSEISNFVLVFTVLLNLIIKLNIKNFQQQEFEEKLYYMNSSVTIHDGSQSQINI